jgi:hypothetical protein
MNYFRLCVHCKIVIVSEAVSRLADSALDENQIEMKNPPLIDGSSIPIERVEGVIDLRRV